MTFYRAPSWGLFPLELRQLNQWCVAGPDKRPWSVTGRPASVAAPGSWTSFEQALHFATLWDSLPGLVLTEFDPYVCIDLDVKAGTATADLERFHAIVDQCASYTEFSRSGRGMHIFVRGFVGAGRRRDGVEIYDRRRFIICTGNSVRELAIAERQAILNRMIEQMPQAENPQVQMWGDETPDWALAQRLCFDDGFYGKLFRGEAIDKFASQSEADLALVVYLLAFTDSPKECWNTFRLSVLGARDKAKRLDYAHRTVSVALHRLRANASAFDPEGRWWSR